MPIYTFYNEKTKKEFEKTMTIAEMEEYLEKNKHIKQRITKVNIADAVTIGVKQPPKEFTKHVLGKVKAAHPKGNAIEKRWHIPKEV